MIKQNNNEDMVKENAMKEVVMLENRVARLTILIDPDKKKAFEDLCDRLDTTPSQALRQMIRGFLAQNNVVWTKNEM